MTVQDQLRGVEQAVGFTYPPEFLPALDTLRCIFPAASLLLSPAEVGAARADLPERLLPFLCEQHPQAADLYAFDLSTSSPDFQVAVWCDHAVVMEWPSFSSFLAWAREHVAHPPVA